MAKEKSFIVKLGFNCRLCSQEVKVGEKAVIKFGMMAHQSCPENKLK